MKLYLLLLLPLSGTIDGMWFDDMSDERVPYSMPLAPMLPPVTTKQERKASKEISETSMNMIFREFCVGK